MANINSNPSLVGFVYQYGEDDFSLWGVEISQADQIAIEKILSKYESYGCSVRGDSSIQINEAI